MTIAAGFCCENGFVVAADSQETVGDHRVSVQKIESRQMGQYQVSLAGTGYGDLIDSFIERLDGRLRSDTANTVSQFKAIFESEFLLFRKEDAQLYPAPKTGKHIRFIVAVASPQFPQAALWVLKGARLKPIKDWDLVGVEDPLYRNAIQRLYSPPISIPQAILTALYMFTIAEATSNWVKSPISVAVVRENGIWMEKANYVAQVTHRLKEYEQSLNRVFLACADTSVSPNRFAEMLARFSGEVVSLHKSHVDGAVMDELAAGLIVDDPYPNVPPGTVISHGPQGVNIMYDALHEAIERIQRAIEGEALASETGNS
jgi:hypothetical protein